MNIIQKSESIRASLWKGFQDGTSKMAKRKCYGYDVGADGGLMINSNRLLLFVGFLTAISAVTVWARLLPDWNSRAFPPQWVSPSGIEKL